VVSVVEEDERGVMQARGVSTGVHELELVEDEVEGPLELLRVAEESNDGEEVDSHDDLLCNGDGAGVEAGDEVIDEGVREYVVVREEVIKVAVQNAFVDHAYSIQHLSLVVNSGDQTQTHRKLLGQGVSE